LEPIPEVTTKEEDAMEAPQELIDRALPIVGFFESSSVDPFTNISSTDTISLGYMQWNWGTKSLINTFMATVRPTDIALADGKIQPVLTTLKMFADKPATISEISGQQAAAQLLANRALVQTWLATEQLRLRQKEMMKPTLSLAYSLSKKWLEPLKSIPDAVRLQTFVYFVDLVVYNGGRAGIWREHVDAFRKDRTSMDIADLIYKWTLACQEVRRPTPHPSIYNAPEALSNAQLWKNKIDADATVFSENEIDLWVFGFLRAVTSNGDDAPKGFPGIFQADVLSRRGVVALRYGTVHGTCYKPDPVRTVSQC